MYASVTMQGAFTIRAGRPKRRLLLRAGRQSTLVCSLLFAFGAAASWAAPKVPQPTLRLKLADLGIPLPPVYLQNAGAAMLTTHFVDNTHLLVTYSLRGLVERIPEDPPTDEDRAVAALLVEIPSGKVLARTRWHLHDYGQYIWSLGNGRFLLRSRSTLTAFAPLANVGTADPFHATPFLHVPAALTAVQVSPEGDMVTVESTPPRRRREPVAATPVSPAAAATSAAVPPPVDDQPLEPQGPGTIFFVRVSGTGAAESPIRALSAGAVRVRGSGTVPLNGRGYLFAKSGKRSRWTLQFDGFDGDLRDLSYVDSSCAPRMQFVSPTQFLVFSCRGAEDKLMVSAYDFQPQEMWEEPLTGINGPVQFAYAQGAGRFAISRSIPAVSAPGAAAAAMEPSFAQEVRVYQMESGDLIAKFVCAPRSTSGQNFDLASDGMAALTVRNGVIEVYPLPAPSPRDLKELAELKKLEPAMPHATRVQLRHLLEEAVQAEERAEAKAEQAEQKTAPEPEVVPPVPAAAVAAVPAPAADAPANAGDAETRRTAPSLLKPGESVEGGKKPKL